MSKMYGQKRFLAQQKGNPTHDASGGSRTTLKRGKALKVTQLSEAQLQGLIAEHLGMIAAEPVVAYVPQIAEHVLPASWTPVR